MAGNYSLRISFSGVLGAQTPVNLMVQSAATDLTRTYGYGSVLKSAAGVSSSIYVQTRDGYGNYVLVDPAVYPSGIEAILFELCNSVKDDPTKACSGGVQELSVSVTLGYGRGVPGSSNTAYGLYTLTYFPFSDGLFMPVVRHNSTIVACLFDSSDLLEVQDPGAAAADACILQDQIDSSSSTTRRHTSHVFTFPKADFERRTTKISEVIMVVNATFQEPDLSLAMTWSFLGPILAAIIGVTVDLCCGFIVPALRSYHNNRRKNAFISARTKPAVEQIHKQGSHRLMSESQNSPTLNFTSQPSSQDLQSNNYEDLDSPVIAPTGTNSTVSFFDHQVTARSAQQANPEGDIVWALTPVGANEVAGPDPWIPVVREH
jgi:hypothetical protein